MPWKSLIHNGICIPEKYKIQHGYVHFNNKKIKITADLEEAFNLYAHEKNKDEKFKQNFLNSIKHLLTFKCEHISQIKLPNFKREKINLKNINKYNSCLINNKNEKIDRCFADPACIFKGRGNHLQRGTFKPAIKQNNISLNISNSKIPDGNWKHICNDNTVDWIASWVDPVTKKVKYIYPSVQSKLNSENSIQKFDFARKLKKKLKIVREMYNNDIINYKNIYDLQHALCTYLIDKTCIRCGSDEEKKTFGCTTLLKKHIVIDKNMLKLNFVGKDSIVCKKSLKIDDNYITIFNNILKTKTLNSQIFDKIDNVSLNKYLNNMMTNLTAKVFRTCHASSLLQNSLKKYDNVCDYKKTLIKVSDLCNHTNTQTAKVNYLDPRITVAFCRKNNINLKKCFSDNLIVKYEWAQKTPSSFQF